MVDAPERIWAYDDGAHIMAFDFETDVGGAVGYIRADIAERELAEAKNHVAELELERARFVAELDAVTLERDANHNLAVANGERAKEEDHRATAAEAERDRLAAEVERLKDELDTLQDDNSALKNEIDRLEARASLQTGEKGE